MTACTVRPLDLDDDRQLRAWHTVLVASRRAEDPDTAPESYDQIVTRLRNPESWAQQRNYLAYVGDEVVGIGWSWCPTNDNLSTAWLRPDIHPDHRRRGHGRALVARLEADLPATRT